MFRVQSLRTFTSSLPRTLPAITEVTPSPTTKQVTLSFDNGFTSTYDYAWLRDNCMCSDCMDPSSGQKKRCSFDYNPLDLTLSSSSTTPTLSPAAPFSPTTTPDDNALLLGWEESTLPSWLQNKAGPMFAAGSYPPDGVDLAAAAVLPHTTTQDSSWLFQHAYNPPPPPEVTHDVPRNGWSAAEIEARGGVVQVDHKAYMEDDDARYTALAALDEDGFVLLKNVPPELGHVGPVAERIAYIKETMYGSIFEVESTPEAANVANTSVSLAPHMDLCYYESPPGLQLLHAITTEATGGISAFVDGYRVLSDLEHAVPGATEILQAVPLTFHYRRDGQFMRFRRPLIERSSLNEPKAFNWSPQFEGPPRLDLADPPVDASAFYHAYGVFSALLRDPTYLYEFRMDAGDLVIFANRRVLHGRTQFDPASGHRLLQGTYLNMDDFRSKFRVEHAKRATADNMTNNSDNSDNSDNSGQHGGQ